MISKKIKIVTGENFTFIILAKEWEKYIKLVP